MTVFKTWLFGVVAASMALSILYALLPKGAVSTAAKAAGSLILILVMLRTIVSLRAERLPDSFEYWQREIAAETEELTQDNSRQMEALIQAECSAYISEKALQMGLTVEATVDCTIRDGVPFPASVKLDIPYNAALSALIAEDLDITPEDQYWQEAEDVP